MIDRKELAHDYFKQGRGCAQAVVMAFADVLNIDINILADISNAFGGGFAKTRGVCGAVSAFGIIAGVLTPKNGDIEKDKAEVYKTTRELIDKFTVLNTTYICNDLLKNMKNITVDYIPTPRSEDYYKYRPCVKFVMDSVTIIEEYFNLN